MATDEHKRLADIVKGTHALLRTECHQYGAETAWERHLARKNVLQVCFKSSLLKIEFCRSGGEVQINIHVNLIT